MSEVKTHRWHKTSREMFKHFMGEGHGDRSSLRQSTQNECPPTMKCRRCQSVAEQDLSWQQPCHKVASVCVEFSSRFKWEQIVNTVTEYMVHITIVQIVLVSTWQTQYMKWRWRSQISMICLFVCKKLRGYCSSEWLLSDWAGVDSCAQFDITVLVFHEHLNEHGSRTLIATDQSCFCKNHCLATWVKTPEYMHMSKVVLSNTHV